MTLPETLNPSPEVVDTLRQKFKHKMETDAAKIPAGGFHENDINKIFDNDVWLTKFLENNVLDMKESLKQLWDTCVWRKTAQINEICEDNIRMDYVCDGIMFPRGKDIDGKTLFIYRSRLYTRGSRNLSDMKRMFLYWLERLIRESNDDYITIMFELTDAGLSNVDMEYTKYIIGTLKNYYPFSLNYILVYDLPWILNATFLLIKKLLPANAIDRLKNINNKTIREYVQEDSLLVPWGGTDDYEFEFIAEQKISQVPLVNNNSILHNNNINNIKKVHFANLSPPDSPMNESSNSNFENVDGEMLRIFPQTTIAFTKSGSELQGNVEITNIEAKPVTYKIKTTAPEKFRVRPSSGMLIPGETATISVVLQQGQQINTISREKFLVMCMALNNETSKTQDLAELWKNTPVSSASVEQHRLRCALPANLDDGTMRNGMPPFGSGGAGGGDMYGAGVGSVTYSGDKQFSHFQQTVSQLNDATHRLESQVKFNQTLQWISLVLFLLLSVAIVYILKAEIKNTASEYCLKH
ncbi:motile sperm domain-containing protein 2-like [Wyeomyia smithii]|uniref:motile sperm domain-containing protein 2-like n=1 Tax=Wyeomyia smithii TaxID=174621 RepID=UPI002467CEFC|nr:motile sperm domain-containing protein 2-like [Wyeomyia smithii]XP_055529048.1 motile sperm domain-containing protein 2-like [Wyeomyia smithii]XP_055529049.1 motile sperm domain-containing protein 2-like [Wyeomyia smithii]XP_055529051.1 motile sperm domain-containing protein 2-like [Wyeomyia smithii]XP_055529052.1 motile sperm domain-containing protein 2-like [Wyeomyia smithii]XP_055529053.1 motile sperm domain-containing protein 2-like [Wyeomyia smithii]